MSSTLDTRLRGAVLGLVWNVRERTYWVRLIFVTSFLRALLPTAHRIAILTTLRSESSKIAGWTRTDPRRA